LLNLLFSQLFNYRSVFLSCDGLSNPSPLGWCSYDAQVRAYGPGHATGVRDGFRCVSNSGSKNVRQLIRGWLYCEHLEPFPNLILECKKSDLPMLYATWKIAFTMSAPSLKIRLALSFQLR
jgi:hypothetical protein